MPIVRTAKIVVLLVLGVMAVLVIAALAAMAFVFSVGTGVVDVRVEATVLDRTSQSPVVGCLLTFDLDRTVDSRTVSARTDSAGRANYDVTYHYVASLAGLYPRTRAPDVRFYLGAPPRYGTFEQIESWDVAFQFDMPWASRETVPQVVVQRNLAREDMMKPPPGQAWQQAGFTPIPTEPPAQLVKAVVRFERGNERETYRIPLTLLFDKTQIASCRADTIDEANRRVSDLYDAGKYQEALEELQKLAARPEPPVWVYRGMGGALGHLGRQKESSEAYRQAVRLAPDDRDILYWYANSLITLDDKTAIAEFQKLVKLEPDNPRGYIGLGNSYYEIDRFRDAIASFARAEKLCATCLNDNDREIYADSKRLVR